MTGSIKVDKSKEKTRISFAPVLNGHQFVGRLTPGKISEPGAKKVQVWRNYDFCYRCAKNTLIALRQKVRGIGIGVGLKKSYLITIRAKKNILDF